MIVCTHAPDYDSLYAFKYVCIEHIIRTTQWYRHITKRSKEVQQISWKCNESDLYTNTIV